MIYSYIVSFVYHSVHLSKCKYNIKSTCKTNITIRYFFKSDSEMFLTLKNGLEAGSCIFQIFLCGRGGSGRQIKSIHNCFFPSGFESMQHSIDWWLLCHGNNEAKNYLTYTGHQFSRDVSGGLFGICGKWRPVAWETAVATVRLAYVLPLLSIWQIWPQQSWCLWFSADVRMFLSWLECLRVFRGIEPGEL